MMIYHSGGNLTIAGSISPVMSLIMIIKTLFSFSDRDFEDPNTMKMLRWSMMLTFLFLLLFFTFNFEMVDNRTLWAKKLPYNKMGKLLGLI